MNNYLDLAIAIAIANPIQKLPKMGAILVTKDGDVFNGKNQYKTHPLQAKWGTNPKAIFLHAEIDCLIKATRTVSRYPGPHWMDMDDSSIYIARVDKKGFLALAKPCAGCMGALIHFGVSNIRWTE